LDPLIRLHRADENSASEMSVILDGLRKLARSSKTAILLVHHSRKAAAGNGGTGLRGSSDLHAFGDSNLYLRKLSQDSALELKIEHRAAAAPAPVRLRLRVDKLAEPSARFEILDAAHQEDPAAKRILELLAKSDAPVSSTTLREKLGIRNQTVAEALKLLQTDGRVQRAGRDGWSAAAAK
jgi:biotin operon repressor